METTFLVKPVKWDKYYHSFLPQNEPHRAKLSFSDVLKHFRGNLVKNSLLGLQSDNLRKMLKIFSEVVFFSAS